MRKKTLILAGFIILKFVLQYTLISPSYDLQRDEYLHLDQGSHLAWGYLSVPPLTSWISWIILKLGGAVWLIRFVPALFGALTIAVVWKTVEALKGNLLALVLSATCVLLSVLLRLNILYQPNSLDVLCWTTLYFCIIKYIQEEKRQWLFMAAVVFAIGFLNKYNIVFAVLGLAPALLLTRHRTLFLRKDFYLALGIGLVMILPNLVWQYQNHFPVVHHMKLLSKSQLVNVNRWDFLKSQLLFFAGSVVVIVAALYALLFYRPFQQYGVFFWSLVCTLVIFLYFRSKDYYAIGIYPVYIAFGAAYITTRWKRYLQPVVLALPVLFFVLMYPIAFPNKSPEYIVQHQDRYKKLGLLRWEDGKDHILPQDFADMLGWKELAQKVDAIYTNNTLVLCDNYGQAGAINYYTQRGIHAVTFNADYIDWIDTTRSYPNLIRVKNHKESGNELTETGPFFQTAVLVDSIANPFAREYRTGIFRFTGARIDIRQRIKDEIAEVKAEMLE